jgi:hypothetical protein
LKVENWVKELKLGTWKTSPGSIPKAFGVGLKAWPSLRVRCSGC